MPIELHGGAGQPSDDELIALENAQIQKEAFEYLSARLTPQEKLMWLAGGRTASFQEDYDREVIRLICDIAGDARVWAGLYEEREGPDGEDTFIPVYDTFPNDELEEKAIKEYRRWQTDLES